MCKAGKGLSPDISIFPKAKICPDFFRDIELFEMLPILAIEIISPSKHIDKWLAEAKSLVQAGVKSVWTVEPFSRSIWVTNEKGTRLFHNTTIESEEIKVDFQKTFSSGIS